MVMLKDTLPMGLEGSFPAGQAELDKELLSCAAGYGTTAYESAPETVPDS
jgi:hypothetical protein